ncbi:MAG: FG-GAP-like repeat-containing protein [Terriglobia bacterium]
MNSKDPFHLESNLRRFLSRRDFLVTGAGILTAGSILRPAGFFPSPLPYPASPARAVAARSAIKGIARPKSWSPLGEVLNRFQTGEHRFSSERNLARLSPGFAALRECLLSGGRKAEALLAGDFLGSSFQPVRETVLRQDELFDIRETAAKSGMEASDVPPVASAVAAASAPPATALNSLGAAESVIRHRVKILNAGDFLSEMRSLLQSFSRMTWVELECTAIEADSRDSGLLRTHLVFHMAGDAAKVGSASGPGWPHAPSHGISGEWLIDWITPDEAKSGDPAAKAIPAKIAAWWPLQMLTVRVTGTLFTDITAQAFGAGSTFRSHLLRDTNYWRAMLDSAGGIDIFGNCGVSVADVDGDGREEIYLCQPQGLPNRLYRQKQPGVFEEFSAQAGVDLLDSTSMALFADILNRGRQDLIVITESAPLLFLNDGGGRFTLAREAFPPSPGATSLTGAAMADYDGDGYLDLYVCAYGYFQGQGGNPLPSPYYDAHNGPPNYLYHNRSDGTFADATETSGLNHGNSRFSFACAWVDFENDGWPDLCVVNDFGRNNYYRNRRDGTFEEVHDGIPGYGSGMSVCAADLSGTGQPDLFVGNMWAPAGLRITRDPEFAKLFTDVSLPSVRQFTMGNALYRRTSTSSDIHVAAVGACPDAGGDRQILAPPDDRAGTRPAPTQADRRSSTLIERRYRESCRGGRSLLWQGPPLLGAHRAPLQEIPDAAGARRGRWAWCSDSFDLENDGWDDLYVANGFLAPPEPGRTPVDAFLWEEVVASSPHSGIVSSPYRAAWTGIFQLAHQGHSWNGNERNVLFLNLGGGRFADVSAMSGLDFPDDGRSFAVFDFDGDGDADLILHSRTGPQLRLLRNDAASRQRSLAVRLTGTKSNRDAIGARVEILTPSGLQTRFVTCGSGFLAQRSKELIFGLGQHSAVSKISIRWPSGTVTELDNLEAGYRYSLTEGQPEPRRQKFAPQPAPAQANSAKLEAESIPRVFSAAMIDPLPLPPLDALRGLAVPQRDAKFSQSNPKQPMLLWLWNPMNSKPEDLATLFKVQEQVNSRLIILDTVAAVGACPDEGGDRRILSTLTERRYSNPPWKADARFEQFISLLLSYVFDYRRKPPSPTGLLIDPDRSYSGEQSEAPKLLKIYWGGADPGEILQDAKEGVASGQAALPFPGRSVLCSFARETHALGAALAQAELYNEAEVYLALAVAGNQKDADTLYNLALVRRELGKYAAAQADAKQALALRPDFPEVENLLGVLLIQSGNLDGARKLFQQATVQSPDFAEAWNNLGYVLLQEVDLPAAEKAFDRALQLAPEFPDALNNFGILLARQGHLEKAQQEFSRALALQPGNEQAANNLGVVYFHQGRPEDARQTFLKLLQHNPDAHSVLLNLAKLDLSLGKKDEARKLLQNWLARHPGDPAAKGLLSRAL